MSPVASPPSLIVQHLIEEKRPIARADVSFGDGADLLDFALHMRDATMPFLDAIIELMGPDTLPLPPRLLPLSSAHLTRLVVEEQRSLAEVAEILDATPQHLFTATFRMVGTLLKKGQRARAKALRSDR